MVNSSNDVLLQEKMEQMMNDIYETLRGLFFNHIHEALPPFERFKVPEIRLSDEIKAKTFGKYSLEEVIEKIEPVIDQILIDDSQENRWLIYVVDIIKQIIGNSKRKDLKDKTWFKDLMNQLFAMLDEMEINLEDAFTDNEGKKVVEAINLLKNVKKTVSIAGEFFVKENQIMLYTKVNEPCGGQGTLENRMLVTLAHELFHAMHCFVTGMDKWAGDEDKARSTVIESLARWAEYCWCKHQKESEFEDIAANLKRDWKISDFPSDPYSAAKVFDNEDVIDLGIEVLAASIKDWDKAYKKIESHRNGKFLKYNIDDEARDLYKKLIRKKTNRDLDTEDWVIIHPHDSKMSEWYNLTLCKLIQYELEQSGFAVTRVPCKGQYLKQNTELVWGKSALLLIKNNGVVSKWDFGHSIENIAKKHVNTVFPFFGDVPLWNKFYMIDLLTKMMKEERALGIRNL